jgi:hypothetical protein
MGVGQAISTGQVVPGAPASRRSRDEDRVFVRPVRINRAVLPVTAASVLVAGLVVAAEASIIALPISVVVALPMVLRSRTIGVTADGDGITMQGIVIRRRDAWEDIAGLDGGPPRWGGPNPMLTVRVVLGSGDCRPSERQRLGGRRRRR